MVYDKAKWHSDGDFPAEVAHENSGTHIGMFLAWAVLHGMAGDELVADAGADLDLLRGRQITGRTLLFNELDGVLCDENLSAEGNAFAASYYKTYMGDYDRLIRKTQRTAYHASDDWSTYVLVEAMINKAYAKFTKRGWLSRLFGRK